MTGRRYDADRAITLEKTSEPISRKADVVDEEDTCFIGKLRQLCALKCAIRNAAALCQKPTYVFESRPVRQQVLA